MLTIIFISFAVCFLIERLNVGWKLPEVPTWTIRVLGVNFVQLGVVLLAGISWEKWLSSFSLFSLSDHVSPVLGGMIAYFIATFHFLLVASLEAPHRFSLDALSPDTPQPAAY